MATPCKDKKLSQLIREGAAQLEPHKGTYFRYDEHGGTRKIVGACAIGCALYACDNGKIDSATNLPGIHNTVLLDGRNVILFDHIVYMNDILGYDRNKIADIVEGLGY